MFKIPPRFLLQFFLLSALSFALPYPAFSFDNRPIPVTDELLGKLNLDRRYHKCISVADGDTLTLEGIGTVRFIGVDTPEKNHPKLPVQFMSLESSAFTKKLCMGKKIRLEYDPYDEDKRGSYGRVLGYLYLEDGTLVQEQLLKNGYAKAYTKYPFDRKRKNQFLAWEEKAQGNEIRLWKDRGMSEVLWILRHGQLMIRVERVSSKRYRLRIGARVSKTFHQKDIGLNLIKLYATAHEFGPRDLRKQLAQSGYKENIPPEPTATAVTVMGMAHRKWGIMYRNRVKPRVPAADLDMQIRELSRWIQDFDAELLEVVLSANGYHPVPEALILTVDQRKIAEGFLKTERIEPGDGRRISWESAGNYIGKRVTVQGTITRSYNSGSACFLNFHRNFTRYMSLVIFKNALGKFPFQPEKFYLNKTVRVRGKIKQHKGRPEIVLNSPKQIQVTKNH